MSHARPCRGTAAALAVPVTLVLLGCSSSSGPAVDPGPAEPRLVTGDPVASCTPVLPGNVLELSLEQSSVELDAAGLPLVRAVGRAVCEPDEYFFANWVAVMPLDQPCPAEVHSVIASRTSDEEVRLEAELSVPAEGARVVLFTSLDPVSDTIECESSCLDTGPNPPWGVSNVLRVTSD